MRFWEELINKISNIIHRNAKTNGSNIYYDLTPEDDIQNGQEYFDALKWALGQDRVKNIALSGPYGSGKSSVIETFLKRNPKIDKRSIKISLATFGDDSDCNQNVDDVIENGILRQLFYHVKYSEIPQSRYRKIHKVNNLALWFFVVGITAVISLFVFIFNNKWVCDNFSKAKLVFEQYNISSSLIPVILLIFVALGTYVIEEIIAWGIGKLGGIEINLSDKAKLTNSSENESVFDKNLDEIVYFFEATKHDLVFIEDIDRFGNTEIFAKLRELNTLLNNYDVIKTKRKRTNKRIVFIYAVKDDMFCDTERTKFFDFIIPIVPYINSTNSGELLRRRLSELNKCGRTHNVGDVFITRIAPFISDMRLLSSIVNEFVIYKATIISGQNMKLDDEKMMSMMVFKNLYPDVFSEMEQEKGVVKQAFVDKKGFVSKKIEEIEKEIDSIKKDLKSAQRPDEELLTQMEIKKDEIAFLRGPKLEALIDKYGSEKIFSESVLKFGFLQFLLRNAYLDETYANYINYFHPDSINSEENSFLVNLRTRGGMKYYDIPMMHVNHVYDRILLDEFGQIEVMNFDLIDYVITSDKKEAIEGISELLGKREENTKAFIVSFFESGRDSTNFVNFLVNRHEAFWEDIYCDDSVSNNTKSIIFEKTIKCIGNEIINENDGESEEYDLELFRRVDVNESLEHYFYESPLILQDLQGIGAEILKFAICALNLHFDNVVFDGVEHGIVDFIIDNSCYVINYEMLRRIVLYKNSSLIEQFDEKNYSTIMSLGEEKITDYILNNIRTYINDVFLEISTKVEEEAETIVDIIKEIKFDFDIARKIIEKVSPNIQSLEVFWNENADPDDIKEKVHAIIDFCMDANLIDSNWKNVETYYTNLGLSDALIKYLVCNIDSFGNYEGELTQPTINAIVNNLGDSARYGTIIECLKNTKADVDIENVGVQGIKVLIEKQYIRFNVDDYMIIAENYPNCVSEYIRKNIKEFIQSKEEVSVEIEDVGTICAFDDISDEDKTEIISCVSPEDITEKIAIYIENTSTRILREYVLSAWKFMQEEARYAFLLKHIDVLHNSDLSKMFSELDWEHQQLADRVSKKVFLHKDGYNEQLVIALKDKKYITSFEETIKTKKADHFWQKDEEQTMITCRIKAVKTVEGK